MQIETYRQLAVASLQHNFERFVQKWQGEGRTLEEVPDTWERDLWHLELDYQKGVIPRAEYSRERNHLLEPLIKVRIGTLAHYFCWIRFERRYDEMEEEARQGDEVAKANLIKLAKEKELGHFHKIKKHNKQVVWWIFEHRDYISKWTLKEMVDKMKQSGVKQGLNEIPAEEDFIEREKFENNLRQLLLKMRFHTSGGKRGRPRKP